MGRRLVLTYLYISLVDLFIYFYLPSPTTRQDSPEVKRFPMAQVIHAVESVVLITSQGGPTCLHGRLLSLPVWEGGTPSQAVCRDTTVWDHCFHRWPEQANKRLTSSSKGGMHRGMFSGPWWGGGEGFQLWACHSHNNLHVTSQQRSCAEGFLESQGLRVGV